MRVRLQVVCARSPTLARTPGRRAGRTLGLVMAVALFALVAPVPAQAWVASPNSIASSGPQPDALSSPNLDGSVPLAWPLAPVALPVAPPAEGCGSPALSVVKVLAVVLGALAALKLPLLLAKLLLAKVLLALPLLLPLALPLLAPFLMIASMLPLPGMMGMDDSSEPEPGPPTPQPPSGGTPGGGNASPVTPSGDEIEARGAWVERCVQRVACHLSTRGRGQECSRFRCAAIDWLGGVSGAGAAPPMRPAQRPPHPQAPVSAS